MYLDDRPEGSLPQQLELFELVEVAGELGLQHGAEGGAEDVAVGQHRGREVLRLHWGRTTTTPLRRGQTTTTPLRRVSYTKVRGDFG